MDTTLAILAVPLYWIVWLISVGFYLVRRTERLTQGIWLLANWMAYLRANETSSTESRRGQATTDERYS